MFPLVKSTEVRSLSKGKARQKRRSSNSHLIPKMKQGWEQWKLMTACNNPGKILCQKNSPLYVCQTGHNCCTFKSVKRPASIQISKHLLLLKHLKKPHTSHSSFLLTSKAMSCNKTLSNISASFLICQKKTFRWLCLHCRQFFFTLSFGGSRWTKVGGKLDFLSLGSLCCEHQPLCPRLPMRTTPPTQTVPHTSKFRHVKFQ